MRDAVPTVVFDASTTPVQWDGVLALISLTRAAMDDWRGDAAAFAFDLIFALISSGPGGLKGSRFYPRTEAEAVGAFNNIVRPCADLLPGLRHVSVVRSAAGLDGAIGLGERRFGPNEMARLWRRDGVRFLRLDGAPPRDPDLVVITLREADHFPQRNSDTAEWIAAARILRDQGRRVVFVRDTACAGDIVAGFETDARAAVDLHCRAALYARASACLFVNNGPAMLAIHMDCPTAVLRPVCADHPASSVRSWTDQGYYLADRPPAWGAHQRYIWSSDTADAIVDAAEWCLSASAGKR